LQRTNIIISLLTAALVAFLAAGAFWLSFDALKGLAVKSGVAVGIAWLYPAIIDGAIIVFSLSVVQVSLNRERAVYPWFLVGLFTLLSVVLNIVHAQPDLLSRLLAAVPPVALFLSFELLMNQLKATVKRTAARQSLAETTAAVQQKEAELNELAVQKRSELDAVVQERTAELNKLNGQIEQLAAQKEELNTELNRLQIERRTSQLGGQPFNTASIEQARATRELRKQAAIDALLNYVTEQPSATLAEIAAVIERSKSTVSNYLNELEANGRLVKNGHGWEVQEELNGHGR
jgi:hypothetical protein